MVQDVKNGFSYRYFYEYLPKRYEANLEQQSVRDLVYNFKDGRNAAIINQIIDGMKGIVTGIPSSWALCCIPASTAIKTQIRFEGLIRQLSSSLEINNGFNYITVIQDYEAGHLGNKPANIIPFLNFNRDQIVHKKIIVLDDIITRGQSFIQVATTLKTLGADSVIGFFIAKTVNPDWEK